jgi:hypothetical protein
MSGGQPKGAPLSLPLLLAVTAALPQTYLRQSPTHGRVHRRGRRDRRGRRGRRGRGVRRRCGERRVTLSCEYVAATNSVPLLSTGETAEEMAVHPRVRVSHAGNVVVDARLAEKHSAKERLSELDGMKLSTPGFHANLDQPQGTVLAHTERPGGARISS